MSVRNVTVVQNTCHAHPPAQAQHSRTATATHTALHQPAHTVRRPDTQSLAVTQKPTAQWLLGPRGLQPPEGTYFSLTQTPIPPFIPAPSCPTLEILNPPKTPCHVSSPALPRLPRPLRRTQDRILPLPLHEEAEPAVPPGLPLCRPGGVQRTQDLGPNAYEVPGCHLRGPGAQASVQVLP